MLLFETHVSAQAPANDNCASASVITIDGSGYNLGTFTSASYNIGAATVQTGETFATSIFQNGQDQKSIWYKFSLPTTRSVKVTLFQPGTAIPADDAGFAVYRTGNCLPGSADISTKFTPIGKFGSTEHPCVDAGDYLVQVSSKGSASGPLYVQLDIGNPSIADYDHPAGAYDFGTLITSVKKNDFDVECQSLEDVDEKCTALSNYQQYTKSTWHTFTTPAYFDFVNVWLASKDCNFGSNQVFGYTLYQGNAKTVSSYKLLSPVDACDSMVTNGNTAAYKIYRCDKLQPNTTYSIQLFYKTDFKKSVRLSVNYNGTNATQAPEPVLSRIPASNQLGTIGTASGTTKNATDYFGCNSRHVIHPCPPSLPAGGILYNAVNYNLSTFYTFTLATGADVDISASASCGSLLLQLYSQAVTNNCTDLDTANIISRAQGRISLDCLPPGTYTVQISGTDSAQRTNYTCNSAGNCQFSNLGQQIKFSVYAKNIKAFSTYSLNSSGAFEGINTVGGIMTPLTNGTTYTANKDTFGCSRTVLPPSAAGSSCRTDVTKAIYHEFIIGDANGDGFADSGVVTLDEVDGAGSSNSALYKGDANAIATSLSAYQYGSVLNGLVPYSQCLTDHYCNNYNQICVTPGTYTLVTFGNDINKNAATRPVIKFDIVATKHFSAATAQDMGSVLDTVGINGGTMYSDRDYFSCLDNAVTINGYAPPSINNHPATKAIYRQFYLSAPSSVRVCSANSTCGDYNDNMRIFSGKASDGLEKLVFFSSSNCYSAQGCAPMPAGWYTVVFYGSGANYANPSQGLNEYGYSGSVGYFTQFYITINTTATGELNRFSLNTNGAYDSVNVAGGVLQPLQNTVQYAAASDTFGCKSTVITPLSSGSCISKPAKASYHQFVIGDANKDNIADSGILTLERYEDYPYSTILYKGDAAALAAAQNAHLPGDTIRNLPAYTQCLPGYSCTPPKICATPGTYTLVTMTDSARTGVFSRSSIRINLTSTLHYDGATAQDMGDLIAQLGGSSGTIYSDKDTFTCIDNAVTINGYAPPSINSHPATKAIYRQFYLSAPADVDVCTLNNGCEYYGGAMVVFSGKATDGLNRLTFLSNKNCFSTTPCAPLEAGWYTVVCYGSGPSFSNPFQDLNEDGYGSAVGHYNQFSIQITKACPGPKYNRPYKAAIDTTTKQPFLLEWKPRKGSTEAYPITDTTYTLYSESFNCTEDTPFTVVRPCDASVNRTIYYVFKTVKESFIQINTQGLYGEVFAGDARFDSASFIKTAPLQPCLSDDGYIQICRLQPGTYTLIMFAGDNNVRNGCGSAAAPTIYIDGVGYSRFDHAKNSYDFGTIPSDSLYHAGKVGDVNPLQSGRAASNDFFYCTTGSQKSDPTESACSVEYNPNVYNTNVNNHFYDSAFLPRPYNLPRRNLWYTFVVDKPGNVHVKVLNKTTDKPYRYPFAVYASDVDGSLSFTTVVAGGLVDSTKAQGLSVVDYNYNYGSSSCQPYRDEISFYRDPCTATGPKRYYVVVDNTNYTYGGDKFVMQPNSQAEVSVMLDTVNLVPTQFDHYYQANDIATKDTGSYKGAQDNYSCATADATDPVNSYGYCAKKTLWYKFTATISGHVKYRLYLNGKVQSFSKDNLQFFRQIIPGDSTSKGLQYITPASYYDNDSRTYWGGNCVAPGTYYLLLTGCNRTTEYVVPEVRLEEEAGDFCSAPVAIGITGVASQTASAIVDCHTIGSDYGEFASQLTCPANANTADYKSSWFRMDIGGKDTLDVTVYLTEATNADADEIKYRLMTGDCNAMQAQECVQDTRTRNTYRCLLPGRSYFIQVFTPMFESRTPVTGNVILNLSSVTHTDTCAPDANCLAVAKFIPQFDCTKDALVKFVNYSTYGSGIQYKWDFGYNNQTSTDVSPSFLYPALDREATYNVKLSMLNKSCNGRDSVVVPVTIPARPHVDLGKDIFSCNPDTSIVLHATSFEGATYQWQNGSSDSLFKITNKGLSEYRVTVNYNGCISRDTIQVYIDDMKKQPLQSAVICKAEDSVRLYPGYYYNVSYAWNTGATENIIYAKSTDTYWVDISNDYCTIRDSFAVTGATDAHPLGNDTAVCFSSGNYIVDATTSGANSYTWDNGSSNPQRSISTQGTYWVDISFGVCSLRDSVVVTGGTTPSTLLTSSFLCPEDSARVQALPAGRQYLWSTGDTTQIIFIKEPGSYSIETIDSNHCRTVTPFQITAVANPTPKIEGSTVLCNTTSVALSVAEGYIEYLWNTGANTNSTIVSAPGQVTVQVKDDYGCKGSDTVFVTLPSSPQTTVLSATLCNNNTYLFPSGKTENQPGTYIDTARTKGGCDSLISTITLTGISAQVNNLSASFCTGSKYLLPWGETVSTGGTYSDTLRTAEGCDSSISRVDLLEIQPEVENVSASLCSNAVYTLPDGVKTSLPGTYRSTLQSTLGCDSAVIITTISILTPKSLSASAGICAGQEYLLPSGKKVTGAGIYTDTVRTALGCDSLYTTVTLSVISSPKTQSASALICSGDAYILPSGKEVFAAGSYRDTVRTGGGCDSLITLLTLTLQPKTATGLQPQEAVVCPGDSVLLTASGGQSYQWSPSGYLSTATGAVAWAYPLATTRYKVVIADRVCLDSLYATVTVEPKPVITIDQSNEIGCRYKEATLTASGAYSYLWHETDSTISDPAVYNPIVNPVVTTVYHVTGASEHNCTSEASIVVKVSPGNESDYNLPKAFTPNNDGLNDCFGVKTWGQITNLKFQVFDRSGTLLFSTTDPYKCWDGRWKGTMMSSATYVYQVSANTNCGYIYRKGWVVLIR